MSRPLACLVLALGAACSSSTVELDGGGLPDAARSGDGGPVGDGGPSGDGGPVGDGGPLDAGPGDAGGSTCGPSSGDALEVTTTGGRFIGVAGETTRFLGLRYAEAPVGSRRFAPPVAAACAPAPARADSFAPACPQLRDGTFTGQEDCLFLNVWTPELRPAAPRPVLVFLHGGGNMFGSAGQRNGDGTSSYDGSKLALGADAVVVTVNYRLHALGFLASERLAAAGLPRGNMGLLDQLEALRWVQANIAGFGGDPARVLLFGESAGAVDTCMLFAAPRARGLFSAALMQSGACAAATPAVRDTQAQELEQAAGCTDPAQVPECLRALDAEALLRARPGAVDIATGRASDYGPTVDGDLLPSAPLELIAMGHAAPVPLVVGSNEDETWQAVPEIPSCMAYEALVRMTFPQVGARVLSAYPCRTYPSPRLAFVALTSDLRFTCQQGRTLRAAAPHGPTHRYFFTHDLEASRLGLQAFHGIELTFVFGNLEVAGYVPTPAERALSASIMRLWGSLARSGTPSAPGVPAWPAWSPERDGYLRLDSEITAAEGVRAAQCAFWDAIVP